MANVADIYDGRPHSAARPANLQASGAARDPELFAARCAALQLFGLAGALAAQRGSTRTFFRGICEHSSIFCGLRLK
jgi:hypothetical protein